MKKKESRESILLNMLTSAGHISTGEAAEMFDVSEATVRRMFASLESSGKAVRNYGGIQQVAQPAHGYSFTMQEQEHKAEKNRIGALAASLVKDNDTIFLDCGTTVFRMTLALSARIAANEFRSLNVVTNSLVNVEAITPTPACRVILVGGEYNSARRDFSGPLTESYVRPFHFTKCFFGCEGLDEKMGYSSNQIEVSSLSSVVIARSDISYVLTDNSKFGRCTLASYAQIGDVHAIITNRRPTGGLLHVLQEAGTEILIAPGSEEEI